jgi:hypothetical protein
MFPESLGRWRKGVQLQKAFNGKRHAIAKGLQL